MMFTFCRVERADEPFLWDMLFYAAHLDDEGATSSDLARSNPFLAQYAEDWGKTGDMGFIAMDPTSRQRMGAAWVRLLTEDKTSPSYVDHLTPELSIAVLPQLIGRGIGTALMMQLLAAARRQHPAIVLTVRANNPAARLYTRLGFKVIGEITNRIGTQSKKMLIRLIDQT